jgi:predicted O-methyltransferase YrrM
MEFLDPVFLHYAEQHTAAENDLLRHINRETHARVMRPRMLSGHLQGRVLAFLSKLVKPGTILEIGTYTGYSAICLAEGLRKDGKLITIDINEELREMVGQNFEASGHGSRIDYRIGNALEIIPTLDMNFDLVFIDADKENYSRYFDMVIDKVSKDGLILADNVLWSGKVVEANPDKDTQAIINFNKKIQEDDRIENILLPIRDGIMMMRKVSL